MGLIGDSSDIKEFEKGLYSLGTKEVRSNFSFLRRLDSLYKLILRGKDTYEEFLSTLRELDAPDDSDAFLVFFIKSLYTEDEFYSIINSIDSNKVLFDGLGYGKVLDRIAKEIHTDYVKSKC